MQLDAALAGRAIGERRVAAAGHAVLAPPLIAEMHKDRLAGVERYERADFGDHVEDRLGEKARDRGRADVVDGDQLRPERLGEALRLPRSGIGPGGRMGLEIDRDRRRHEKLPGCARQPGRVVNAAPREKGAAIGAGQATIVPGAAAVTEASTWFSNFSKFFRNMPTSFAACAS